MRTAYGPNGLNKIVINHIDKLFVTNDAVTILKELEVEHPAAKLMVLTSKMQEEEVGDGTNFVIIFCGALLDGAEILLRMGLAPIEIYYGYSKALAKCLEILPTLVCHKITDLKDEDSVARAIRGTIMSKQYGSEDFLSKLIAKACVSVLPENSTFNVENIQICKILGSGLQNSEVVQGLVFKRHVEGVINSLKNAKVVVYTCPVDTGSTETKGTVLIKTAEELTKFSEGEESMLEKQLKAIKDAGADVIVSGAKFGDMALHFINRLGMMAVKLSSKFDVRRLCKTLNATALPSLQTPMKEELGFVDDVYVDEIGDTSIVVFKMAAHESRVATIVLRGSTQNYMDDIERAVDDGVNIFKGLTRGEGCMLPGAGAVEVELALRIRKYAETLTGLDQYPMFKYAEALEALPRALAENSGLKPDMALYRLREAHNKGETNKGLNIQSEDDNVLLDAHTEGIWDLYQCKHFGLHFATDTATVLLRVDQIVMAKRAGGPSVKAPNTNDDD
ncbi:hypothetical protein AAG570_008838 [Ranatra chinensis]|uniref:T-complex protein 1 subunit theta n=1 Tax=Ranatra chinensis TaxID=642074 RepID=A0ABD0YS63_9HEMI